MKNVSKFLVTASLIGMSNISYSAENGGSTGAAAFGLDGMSNFYLPQPGAPWLVNYTGIYNSTRINGPDGKDAAPNTKLHSEYNVFALKYLPDTGILGSTWTAFEIFPTLVRTAVTNGSNSSTNSGFADLAIDPFGLAWKVGNANVGFGTTFTAPTGEYDRRSDVNLGNNHWSWNPQFYYNWFDPQGRGDISVHASYELNFKNRQGLVTYFNPTGASYTSGQMVHLEVASAYNATPKLSLAASVVGSYQFTDDKVDDEQADQFVKNQLDGNRYESIRLGLSARYLFLNSIPVNLTYTHDTYGRNKAMGDALVLRIVKEL